MQRFGDVMTKPEVEISDVIAAEQLTATAYHEAGHAVMAVLVGRPIQKVTINAGRMAFGVRLGACELQKGRRKSSDDPIEDEALIYLAGMVAESHFTGKYCQSGARQDLRAVARLLQTRAGRESQMERLQSRLVDKVEHLLSDDAHAKAVELVAQELIVKTTISGRAVRHFFQQAQAMFKK